MHSFLHDTSQKLGALATRIPESGPLWIALLLVLGLAAPASALLPDRGLSDYTLTTWVEDLPHNTVMALAQTPDGYLWLGTYEGLARFDGLRFVVFDRRDVPAFGDANEIFDLAADRRGRLWIATSTSLAKLEDGGFERILGPESLGGEAVHSLALTEDGVWVAAPSRLLRLGVEGDLVRAWEIGEGIPTSFTRCLLADTSGALWVGFESGEVMRLAEGQIQIFGQAEGLPPRPILALAEGPGGELWIGTQGAGLFRKHGTTLTRFGVEDGLNAGQIRRLYVDSHGVLWLGTIGGGVYRYAGGRFSALTYANGMPSDVVRSMVEDREGGMWIGTNGGGLVALHEKKFSAFDSRDGLRHDNVRAVLEDRSGALWIGTEGGGLQRLDGQRLSHYGEASGLKSSLIRSLHEDRQGRLWVGTSGAGLARLEGDRFIHITSRDGLASDLISVIHEDTEGAIWVGNNRGLNRIALDGSITQVSDRGGVIDELVTSILESSRGGLWVGTVGGLHRVTDERVKSYRERDGLPSSRVFSLHEEADGTLWIGTNRGLCRYRDGELRTITSRDGLYDDVVFSILDDGRGRFWMSSNRGVFSVAREELAEVADRRAERLTSAWFGRSDGMGANQCNGLSQPVAGQARDGRLLFATVGGVAMLDLDRLAHNPLAPPVVVEEMIVDDQPVALTEEISLGPGRGERIEFRYTGLSLQSPERVRFRYRLEGFDRGWVAAEDRRVAYYTQIPPGDYRFRVVAANEDGVWSDAGASVSFVLRPFFYQTAWFPWVLGAALLALAWTAHRWRLLRAEAQHRELAELVEARTGELEAATHTLHQLSISDSLTGVANRRRLDQVLEEEWMRARRRDGPLSLLMIDLDFFKQYNDTYGHQKGDEVLQRLAVELRASARRAGDLVARYGGEEFVIVAPGIESAEAEQLAEKVRQRIAALAIPHASSSVAEGVTISIGVATLHPAQGGDPDQLVRDADQALYRAKHGGRDQVARAGSRRPLSVT